MFGKIFYFENVLNFLNNKAAESEKCASFKSAMDNRKPTYTKSDSTLADGLAVPTVGVNAFASVSKLVDNCVIVKYNYFMFGLIFFLFYFRFLERNLLRLQFYGYLNWRRQWLKVLVRVVLQLFCKACCQN
jgi:hypothetical protein